MSGRLPEILESLKAECETLSADASMYKHRAEDAERKLQGQLQEMTNIQTQIGDLERTFQKMKTAYESEITQLRRQIEQLGASPVTADSTNRTTPNFPSPSVTTPSPSVLASNAVAQAPAGSLHMLGGAAMGAKAASSVPLAPLGKPPMGAAPGAPVGPRFPTDGLAAAGLAAGLLPGAPPGSVVPKMPAGIPMAGMGPLGPGAPGMMPGAPGAPMFHPGMMDPLVYQNLMRQYDPHMAAAAAAAAGIPIKQQPGLGGAPSIDPSLIAAVSGVPNAAMMGRPGQQGMPAPFPPQTPPPPSPAPKKAAAAPTTPQSQTNGTNSAMEVDTPPKDSTKTNENFATTTASSAEWSITHNTNVKKQLDVALSHDLDHNSVVCCVKFSSNGKYLATGCKSSAQLFDVESGQKMQSFVDLDPNATHQGDPYIRSVCFSPDNMTLATGAEDRTIKLWDVQSGTVKHNLQGHSLDIYSLDYSRDGRLIVSGSGDRHVKVWDAESGRLLHNLGADDVGPKDGVTSVAFSPDGRFVAAGSLDRVVRIWDVQTGYFIDRFEGHQDSVYSVAFDPEGKTVASGSLDKTLRLWDVSSRSRSRCRHTFVGHKDFVLSVAFSPDGGWIASGSKDRAVHFWDPRTANLLMTLNGHKNSVISVAVCSSPADSSKGWISTGSGDHRARIWNYQTIGSALASSSSAQ